MSILKYQSGHFFCIVRAEVAWTFAFMKNSFNQRFDLLVSRENHLGGSSFPPPLALPMRTARTAGLLALLVLVCFEYTFVYEWGWGVRQAGHGLWRARSRLYRSRFLRPNCHFAAFLEIYKIDIPSHRFAFKKKDFLKISFEFAKFW